MAEIRNTASMRLRGRVGNTTYYVEGGRQLARVSQNSSNYGESARRSESQQSQRAKWGNLVNFFRVSQRWMSKAYESKKRTQSDYNRFMQLNVPLAKLYLERNQYAMGGCVVDAFKVSEGSLKPISVLKVHNVWRTDLAVGSLAITDATKVRELTQALIANNNHLAVGMQISFISYQQMVDANGIPQLYCTAYEMTLSLTDDADVRSYLPVFCSSVVDGYLGTNDNISTGAFTYILSDSTSGRTRVSTQTLVTNNDALILKYSSDDAYNASIASYGVDADVFLMSGSKPQDATPQPQFIEFVALGEDNYADNDYVGKLSDVMDSNGMVIMFGNNVTSLVSVKLEVAGGYAYTITQGSSVSGRAVTVTKAAIQAAMGSSVTFILAAVSVLTSDGEYVINFRTTGADFE